MTKLIRFVAPLALLVGSFAGVSHAASSARISAASAKGFIKQAIVKETGRSNWSISLGAGSAAKKSFRANVKWGPGPHIMIAIRPVTGDINMKKGAGVPAGVKRVRIFNRNP